MTGNSWVRYTRQTLFEIWMGIGVFGLVGVLVILFLPTEKLPAILAYLLGAIVSACAVTHIAYVTELTMDMHNMDQAQKYTTGRYLIRMTVYAVVIIAAYYTSYLNIPALVIGLFGTKVGAYLQPLMHRFLEWTREKVSKKREGGE